MEVEDFHARKGAIDVFDDGVFTRKLQILGYTSHFGPEAYSSALGG
jgi:hypothetical protein